jgi:GNAT superfamily N-acetyltransferase
MALAAWWHGDTLTALPTDHRVHVSAARDDAELVTLNRISRHEVQQRRADGHTPYVLRMDGQPAAYGWVATQAAAIGELGLYFSLPPGSRYLWDFATLPQWQGRGLYPRLLQAIIRSERAARFWIIYAPENLPSGAGIQKAGFASVGQLSLRRDGLVGLAPLPSSSFERALSGAALLNVPLLTDDGLSPCWRCTDKLICTCQHDPASCSCGQPIRPSKQDASPLFEVRIK